MTRIIRKMIAAIVTPAAMVILSFVALAMSPVSASGTVATAAVSYSPMSGTGGSGINVSGILSALWNTVFKPIMDAITKGFGTIINDIATGFGGSISTMFTQWANSLYGIGIWAPVIFVLVLSAAGATLYFFLDVYGIERDALHGEEDI